MTVHSCLWFLRKYMSTSHDCRSSWRPEPVGAAPLQAIPQRRPIEDDLIIYLAVNWLPYGGPPIEIVWVSFGLTKLQYWRRVHDLATQRARCRPCDTETLEQLRASAIQHLRLLDNNSPRLL